MKHILKTGLAVFLLSSTALTAQEMTAEEVKRLALEAILENPQVIMEAVAILQERDEEAASQDAARVLSEQRLMLEQDPNAPVLGNSDGDVTVVEFFDYNCPYCKQVSPEVEALIAVDSNVCVVFREWPILSEGSVFAVCAALASRAQDKYPEFHLEMMRMRGRAEEVCVMAMAEKIGLDLEQLRTVMDDPEITDHIDISMNLARLLGFNGTPSFVIGDAMVPGMVPLDELQRLVGEARDGQ